MKIVILVLLIQSTLHYDLNDFEELRYSYGADTKNFEYVPHPVYSRLSAPKSRHYYNSLAVLAQTDSNHAHGLLGLHKENQTKIYIQKPPLPTNITEAEKKEQLKAGGGFRVILSDTLPLDRIPAFQGGSVCAQQKYDFSLLEDASIIITIHNEPMSIILRSIHSILNYTPPPLIREILLIDDHSMIPEYQPGGYLEFYVKHLPKTKIIRLPERRGLVHARLLGAQISKAPIIVVLDSHIEVTPNWLEAMLDRIRISPKSLVFPQIPSLNSVDFKYELFSGIGCKLTFKWIMQEQAQAPYTPQSADAVPSPSMAGGLFAVRRDLFWAMGSYDEQFTMWGAENVEMPFRYWMCGARVECVPCSAVYHMYRHGGSGYRSPSNALAINRLRTAKAWTHPFYEIASTVLGSSEIKIGSLEKVQELQKRLKCNDFFWYLKNVDYNHKISDWSNISIATELKNVKYEQCLDNMQVEADANPIGLYYCHQSAGSQAFIFLPFSQELRPLYHDAKCVSTSFQLSTCSKGKLLVEIDPKAQLVYTGPNLSKRENCLGVVTSSKIAGRQYALEVAKCDKDRLDQKWLISSKKIQIPLNNSTDAQSSTEPLGSRLKRWFM